MPAQPDSPKKTLHIAAQFGLLSLVGGVLWRHSLRGTLELALGDEAYTHILLILPLVCGLLLLEHKQPRASFQPGVRLGTLMLGVALLIAGFVRVALPGIPEDIQLSLSMFALVTWWIGSLALCCGRQVLRTAFFPLIFLFWVVPLPAIMLDAIVQFLQHQSAFAARVMFMAAGVPVTQDGVMLVLPNLDIEVARECSSIRSSMMLGVTTVLLSHLFLRSWWRKALLIAAVIPLAAIKNGFRIFVITELATRVDPSFFNGNLHRRGGILFLLVALAMEGLLLLGLRRTEFSRGNLSSTPMG